MGIQWLPGKLRDKALEPRFASLITVVNLAGTGFGFYYYREQLAGISPHLWIFVADSPIATLLMAASLTLYLRGSSYSLLDSLAFLGNFKYGLWTSFILLFYFDTFTGLNSMPMYAFLLFSHLLMAVQAYLVLDYSPMELRDIGFAASWFLLNDSLDYLLDIHTRIYVSHDHPLNPAMYAAVSLTLLGAGLLYLHYRD